jgi:hypothetical protein
VPGGVVFVSCCQLGVVPTVLAFFFYETDTPARVVSLKKNSLAGVLQGLSFFLFSVHDFHIVWKTYAQDFK